MLLRSSVYLAQRACRRSAPVSLKALSSRWASSEASRAGSDDVSAKPPKTAKACPFSTETVPKQAKGCPFSTETTVSASGAVDSQAAAHPELVEVPSLPIVGSLITSYSGIPPLEQDQTYDFWPGMRKKFGDFYSFGLPGMGDGSHGTVYVLSDPHEMMRVLRSEGKYPFGAIMKQVGFQTMFQTTNNQVGLDLISQGPAWKRVRSFLQTDLLSPQSAARYIPGIVQAAQHASKGAANRSADLGLYLNEASFDMFMMVLLGELTSVSSGNATSEDLEFCASAATALRLNNVLTMEVKEIVAHKVGIKTPAMNTFLQAWDKVIEFATNKVESFLEKRERGQLTKAQTESYVNQAMERQAADNVSLSVEDVRNICVLLMAASVDTTAGMMAWHLLHLSQNPETQERIHEELQAALKSTDGTLTVDTISHTSVPYLHAAIRESHRLTSPATVSIWKSIPENFAVHGHHLPPGSMVAFDGYSKGRCPELLGDDVDEFRPERFLPEGVAARKGTVAECIDHPVFGGPFSQGARRCPGSRVSKNEALLLLSQIILDYKLTCPVPSWKDVSYRLDTITVPNLPPLEFIPRSRSQSQ